MKPYISVRRQRSRVPPRSRPAGWDSAPALLLLEGRDRSVLLGICTQLCETPVKPLCHLCATPVPHRQHCCCCCRTERGPVLLGICTPALWNLCATPVPHCQHSCSFRTGPVPPAHGPAPQLCDILCHTKHSPFVQELPAGQSGEEERSEVPVISLRFKWKHTEPQELLWLRPTNWQSLADLKVRWRKV